LVEEDGVKIMKTKLLWVFLGILLFFIACSKPKEVVLEGNGKPTPPAMTNKAVDQSTVKAPEDDSPEALYTRYVEKYGGDLRSDYALVGSIELVLHLDELAKEVKNKIEYVSIESPIEEVPEIIGLSNLKSIQLRALGIQRIENLGNLKVESVSLVLNPLESIAPIGRNPYITNLNLTSSGIQRLPDMSGMKNLRVLGLLRSDIITLDNIQTIPNSIELNILECDELEDIDALRFAKIRKLYIGKDGINSIGGKGDTKGLYDKNKDWFEQYLPQLKSNDPNFELLFYMKEG